MGFLFCCIHWPNDFFCPVDSALIRMIEDVIERLAFQTPPSMPARMRAGQVVGTTATGSPLTEHSRLESKISVTGNALGNLEVEGNPFAIDQHSSSVQKLLAGAVVDFIAMHG